MGVSRPTAYPVLHLAPLVNLGGAVAASVTVRVITASIHVHCSACGQCSDATREAGNIVERSGLFILAHRDPKITAMHFVDQYGHDLGWWRRLP